MWLSQEHDAMELMMVIVYDGQHSKLLYYGVGTKYVQAVKECSICFDKVFINETISSSTLYQFEFREYYSQNYRFERIDALQ